MQDQHEDDIHYMSMALKVAKAALAVGEVPVGSIIVLKDHPAIAPQEHIVISHGANQVNATRDASRHAEIVAIDRILTDSTSSDSMRLDLEKRIERDIEGIDGTTFNFLQKTKQKLGKSEFGWQQNKLKEQFKSTEVFKHCELYVTCEPCIMCASALATVGIKRVVFGCENKRFGGCGSLMDLHCQEESLGETGYLIRGRVLEYECVSLLRDFYQIRNSRHVS